MLHVLIIDDNAIRAAKIHKILTEIGVSDEYIDTSHSSIPARYLLRTKKYDLLLLDVCLPKREGDRPSKDEGVSLLTDLIDKNKYIMPDEVIGITEYDEIFKDAVKVFHEKLIYVIKYAEASNVWMNQLTAKVNYKIASRMQFKVHDHAIITVHGIRTYGNWQSLLEDTIKEQGISADVINYKYSYMSALAYFSFIVRKMLARRFKKQLVDLINTNKYEVIDIVGHSFGTYLIAQALKDMCLNNKSIIRNVIFSGSVVNENYDWSKIVGVKIQKIINDCAYDDMILIINKCLIPFGGMSGRVGFKGFESSVINRYFKGGHDAYYIKNNAIDNTFIKKYWIPLLTIPDNLIKYDSRGKPKLYEDLIVFVQIISIIKNTVCILIPITVIIIIIYQLY